MASVRSVPAIGGSLVELRPGRTLNIAARPGTGDVTVFFCHGGGGNKEHWRFAWDALGAAGYGLVAWDGLGHGTSPRPRDTAAYSGTASLADYAAVVARYRTARTVLVGHSFGARQTLVYLDDLARQERLGEIDRAVLVAPAPILPPGTGVGIVRVINALPMPVLSLLRPVLSRGFRKRAWHPDTDPATVAGEERMASRNSLFAIRAVLTQPAPLPIERLAGLDLPVLVIGGEADGIVSRAATGAIVAALPRATLLVMAGAAHQVMMEQPDRTSRAIREFVDGG